ncbi:hypothetical protein D187_006052 [Cystobacter fuscus DSM 2262]|uniref:DUF2795 domain-containing protein n=2 Tax=Cystobacter fuscus TaxID=43 RepID=S9QQV0_CYSF2|nr:hypothetical protein D187_006052 [Cystobacter fuscus DSM 2262]
MKMKQIHGGPGLDDPAGLVLALSQALRGAVFPLSRTQLVWLARENDAAASLLTRLSGLPEGVFASLAEVERALGVQAGEGTPATVPPPLSPNPR